MDACLREFCVYVYVAALRHADSPSKESTDCPRLRNWSETKRFTDAPMLQVGATGIYRYFEIQPLGKKKKIAKKIFVYLNKK
jgi:hypothetical protein